MPMISRQGISGCAARNAGETLPAASPITSSERITAFWCKRLARNAASSMPPARQPYESQQTTTGRIATRRRADMRQSFYCDAYKFVAAKNIKRHFDCRAK
jgi:hypothetical protein